MMKKHERATYANLIVKELDVLDGLVKNRCSVGLKINKEEMIQI